MRPRLALLLVVCACEGQIGSPFNSLGGAPVGTAARIPQGTVRRLTAYEYDNALKTLLNDQTRPGAALLPPDFGEPFDNESTRQQASQQLIDAAELLAQNAFRAALADPIRRAALVPCVPNGRGDGQCLSQFVEKFGRRAFRRAMSPQEVQSYVTAFLPFATESNAALSNDFYTAVSLAGQAILQDPEFLYRIEAGTSVDAKGIRSLSDYEIAARMSFYFWADLPDDTLLDEAEAGRLTGVEGRRSAAVRMLADPRTRRQVQRFHAYWLGYKSLAHSAQLVAAFSAETQALVDRVVFDSPGRYSRLFTSNETFIDTVLGAHYSIPGATATPKWMPYPSNSKRAGILSHGAVLSAFAKFSDTSPTQRGIFVRTRLLCEPTPVPPANVDADKPPPPVPGKTCKSDRYAEHRTSAACAGCHAKLDPIGFGLENFNLAGVWRTHDDGDATCTIDGRGSVAPLGDFSGPAELALVLTQSGKLETCATRQLFRFAHGRHDLEDDAAAINWLADEFAKSDFAFDKLLLTVVTDDAFAFRKDQP